MLCFDKIVNNEKINLQEGLPVTSICQYMDNDPQNTIYIVEDVLNKDECNLLIQNTLQQDSLDREYEQDKRDASRLLVDSPNIASVFWHRLQPLINNLSKEIRPMGFGTSGKWIPSEVNPCIRFSTYEPNSKGFQSHRDGAFVKNPCERSIWTILIYLNDCGVSEDFDKSEKCGGQTHFYKGNYFAQNQSAEEEMKKNPSRIASITPVAGRCVVFTHNMLHQGEAVHGWTKKIIRADLVFKRLVDTQSPRDVLWYRQPEFYNAVSLYQKAFALELDGDVVNASKCYEEGLMARMATLYDDNKALTTSSSSSKQTFPTWVVYRPIPWNVQGNCGSPPRNVRLKLMKPTLEKRDGISSIFSYNRRFFDRNTAFCLRVIAVYAISLFGHSNGSRFVIHYNREKDEVTTCEFDELLRAAFTGSILPTIIQKRCDLSTSPIQKIADGPSIDLSDIKIEFANFTKNTDRYRVHVPRELTGTFYHAATCCSRSSKTMGGHHEYCDATHKQQFRKMVNAHVNESEINETIQHQNNMCRCDEPPNPVVTIHETRSFEFREKGVIFLNAIFVGIDCL